MRCTSLGWLNGTVCSHSIAPCRGMYRTCHAPTSESKDDHSRFAQALAGYASISTIIPSDGAQAGSAAANYIHETIHMSQPRKIYNMHKQLSHASAFLTILIVLNFLSCLLFFVLLSFFKMMKERVSLC